MNEGFEAGLADDTKLALVVGHFLPERLVRERPRVREDSLKYLHVEEVLNAAHVKHPERREDCGLLPVDLINRPLGQDALRKQIRDRSLRSTEHHSEEHGIFTPKLAPET